MTQSEYYKFGCKEIVKTPLGEGVVHNYDKDWVFVWFEDRDHKYWKFKREDLTKII